MAHGGEMGTRGCRKVGPGHRRVQVAGWGRHKAGRRGRGGQEGGAWWGSRQAWTTGHKLLRAGGVLPGGFCLRLEDEAGRKVGHEGVCK